MAQKPKLLSSTKCFGGFVQRFQHNSDALSCEMKFSVFLPQVHPGQKLPAIYWLSGLTCTDENFITKAGAERAASEHQVILVCPDTSPRGVDIEGADASWDFGFGAGFYVNAVEQKWAKHFRMYDYVTKELPQLVNANLPVDSARVSISGHSMGGHGALICALKNPGMYKSVSAFAPICHPVGCPWGIKAFTGYLGANEEAWKEYDATFLIQSYSGPTLNILIDQGTEDKFLAEQLKPETFAAAAKGTSHNVQIRMQDGYDHSYYFIATFIDAHIAFHAAHLQ